jgi:hypothetical protein
MNCDQVFEVLTSGPFPAGHPSDSTVELHLQSCHDCRQLAEALRPAVEMLHESLAGTDNHALPSYEGTLRAADVGLPQSVMTMIEEEAACSLAVPVATTTERRIGRNGWPIAVAIVMVVFMGVLAVRQQFPGQSATDYELAGTPSSDHQPDDSGKQYLLAMRLPTICFHIDESRTDNSQVAPRQMHLCCTQCHNAARPDRSPLTNVAFLERSCKACHQL